MTYLKGKDLRHKGDGHTLECWYSSIPDPIVMKVDKPEAFAVEILKDGTIWVTDLSNKKPEEFQGW